MINTDTNGTQRCVANAKSDRGSALVMAVFVLALLTSMGTALLFMSQHEARMSRASLHVKQAFYLAEAAVEDGRISLYVVNADGDLENDLVAAAGPNGSIEFDADQLALTYDANGSVTGAQGFGDDVPLRGLTTLPNPSNNEMGWYAAFLTNDPVDGRPNLADSNSRVLITAVGAHSEGAREMVEAIVEPYFYLPEVPAAGISLLGPLPSFDNGASAAQDHVGEDCGVPGAPYAPIVGTIGSDASTTVEGDMQRPDAFGSGPFIGGDTVGDLTDPTDPVVAGAGHGTIDPDWRDCETLKSMVMNLALVADHYCNSDSAICVIPATMAPDDVVFIDGDLLETPDGNFTGILVVTGQLVYDGNTGWDGVILAVGEGDILRNGGGGANPRGAVVIANIDPTPNGPRLDKTDWCTTSPDGFGQAHYETQGGGNSTVTWCSSSINAANSIRSYKVVEFLQR